jgi:large subunit ribosomal protein L23
MKEFLKTIRQPLITEKSTILREKDGTYCFRVHPNANKIEIAHAIESIFVKDKVKVAAVRTSRVNGKLKRMGRFSGHRASWKKAWVKLAPGSGEIEFFEST